MAPMELHVRVVSARNLLDKQTFGKQDPYCKIKVGRRSHKTRVDDNGHRTPRWNEVFSFEVVDPQLEQLEIQVKDKNFTASVLIGEARLPLNMFMSGQVVDNWYPLNCYQERSGEINLRIQLLDAAGHGKKAPKHGGAYHHDSHAHSAAYPPHNPNAYAPQQASYPQYAQQQNAYPSAYPAPDQPPMYAQQVSPSYPPQQYPPQQYPPQSQMQQYPTPPPMQQYPSPPPMHQYPAPPMMQQYPAPPPMYGAPGGHMPYDPKMEKHYYKQQKKMHKQEKKMYKHQHKHGGGYGNVAMGVGAGILGGMLLGEALD